MIKLGDVIVCEPGIKAPNGPKKGTVVYIHPLGRFYEVEFQCRNGSFRETREFTAEQMEEAYNLGIFERPQEEILFNPYEQRKHQQSQQWRATHRPVEEPDYDGEDDISTIMAMA